MSIVKQEQLYTFYVTGTNAYTSNQTDKSIESTSPENALNEFLNLLPNNWIGGIEVNDDETLNPDAMPLIDFWLEGK